MTELQTLVAHAAANGWVHFPDAKQHVSPHLIVGAAWSTVRDYNREYARLRRARFIANGLNCRGKPRVKPIVRRSKEYWAQYQRDARMRRVASGLTVHGTPRKRPYLPRSKNHDSA